MVLPLQNGTRTEINAYKTNEICMVLADRSRSNLGGGNTLQIESLSIWLIDFYIVSLRVDLVLPY